MEGFIQLLRMTPEGDTYFVAFAEPKRKFETVKKLQKPGEKKDGIKTIMYGIRNTSGIKKPSKIWSAEPE